MIPSVNMAPALPRKNAKNLRLLDVKSRGYLALSHSPAKSFNFAHLGFSEFGSAMSCPSHGCHKSASIGMVHVFCPRHPFEIIGGIVRLVPVYVIDLMIIGWLRLKKSVRNQPMDKFRVVTPAGKKRSPYITRSVIARGQNYRLSLYGLNKSGIRNLVGSFETNNRTPNFQRANSSIFDTLMRNMGGVTSQRIIEGDLH